MNIIKKIFHLIYLMRDISIVSRIQLPDDDKYKIVVSIKHMEHIRPLRWLLIIFQLAERNIYLLGRLDSRTFHFASDAKWHPNVRVIWQRPKNTGQIIYCSDNYDDKKSKYFKHVQLQYDYGPALSLPDQSHFIIPFTMHTQLYCQYHEHDHLKNYREQPRSIRLLVAGNYNEFYDNKWINDVCEKLSRFKIVQHLKSKGLVTVINTEADFSLIQQNKYRYQLILVDQPLRINQQDWLKLVANSEFILSMPGILFPISHSLIEAMAVGTIPLLNYCDWVFPSLINDQNCLTFNTLDDLEDQIAKIQTMEDETISLLKQEVIRYYETHLNPANFVERLLQSPYQSITLHMLDESENAVLRATRKTSENITNINYGRQQPPNGEIGKN